MALSLSVRAQMLLVILAVCVLSRVSDARQCDSTVYELGPVSNTTPAQAVLATQTVDIDPT